jgi:RNA methyltransferase, TrmH family
MKPTACVPAAPASSKLVDMRIDSLTNTQVKRWVTLQSAKGRAEHGTFLVEGEHLVDEAVKTGWVRKLLIREGHDNPYPTLESVHLSAAVFKKVSQLESLGWIVAECTLPPVAPLIGSRFLVADRIQDPGNLGTILRIAVAFGFDQVLCSPDCVDLTNEKVIRSTQGALFHVPVVRGELPDLLQQLRTQGIVLYATAADGELALSQVAAQDRVALILGNEGSGVSSGVLKLADHRLKIEMSAFESLNVAIAAGIVAYHFRK